MDGPWGYHAKWNESDEKSNTSWSHLYVKSKKKKPNPEKQRTGWWSLDAGSGYGEIEWKQSKVTNF